MKNTIAKTAALTLAATLLTACGGQSAASIVQTDSSTVQEETQPGGTQNTTKVEDDTENSIRPRTYVCTYSSNEFQIDFREYPMESAGEGYIENLNEIALGIGASNNMTEMVYEIDLSPITEPTQVPDTLNPCILSLLEKAQWNGVRTGGEMNQTFTLDKVESVGTENDYELCRFEGTYSLDTHKDDKTHYFAVVGYTVLLKQSGYPVYVIAADMSDDQHNVDQLDQIAHDSIASLHETA